MPAAAANFCSRIVASVEMVKLAEERLLFWHQIRELAGLDVPQDVQEHDHEQDRDDRSAQAAPASRQGGPADQAIGDAVQSQPRIDDGLGTAGAAEHVEGGQAGHRYVLLPN